MITRPHLTEHKGRLPTACEITIHVVRHVAAVNNGEASVCNCLALVWYAFEPNSRLLCFSNRVRIAERNPNTALVAESNKMPEFMCVKFIVGGINRMSRNCV